eukprot:SAG25_NODE_393_length_8567_cov_15.363368_14_plen_92_part_00
MLLLPAAALARRAMRSQQAVVHRHSATACPHLLPVLRLREKVRSQPSPPPARACRVQVSVLDGVLAPRPGLRRPKGLAFPPPSPRAVRQDG